MVEALVLGESLYGVAIWRVPADVTVQVARATAKEGRYPVSQPSAPTSTPSLGMVTGWRRPKMLGERMNAFMGSRGIVLKREFVRSVEFLSVSFVSAASNLLYVAVLTHFSALPFWLVSLTSTEFSMVVNFTLNDRFTFRNLESNRVWFVRLARFQVAALGGNLLTAILSTALHDGLSLSPIYAQGVAITLTFFLNFLAHRFWTFKGRPVPERAAGALSEAVSDVGNELGALLPTPGAGVSAIAPVCDESATMRSLLMRLHQAMTSADLTYEVLIVDDFSEDDTAKVAAGAIEEYDLPGKVLVKLGKVGKSFSLEQGFAQAQYPILAMIDGDLELPPEALPAMVGQLAQYDVVVGRRLSYGKDNFLRAQLTRVFNCWVFSDSSWVLPARCRLASRCSGSVCMSQWICTRAPGDSTWSWSPRRLPVDSALASMKFCSRNAGLDRAR